MNAIAYMLHFRLFLLHMLPTHSHWPTFVDYRPGTLKALSDIEYLRCFCPFETRKLLD